VNYLETTRAAQAAAVIESQKAMLESEGLLSRETDPTKVPDGWKGTQLMQMRGLSFPPHIADAYDQFAEKMGRGSPDLLDKINRFNVQMVLMNPLMHGKNVVSNWITGKLAEGIASGRILTPSATLPTPRLASGRSMLSGRSTRTICIRWSKGLIFYARIQTSTPGKRNWCAHWLTTWRSIKRPWRFGRKPYIFPATRWMLCAAITTRQPSG